MGAVLSLIMSLSGFLLLFFMVPLQVIAIRRGEKGFLISAMGVFFGNLVLKLILSPEAVSAGIPMTADIAVFLILLGGLYAVNFKLKAYKGVIRFLIVTVGAAIASLPVLLYLSSDPSFVEMMKGQIDSVLVMLQKAFPGETVFGSLTTDAMYSIFRNSFLSSYLAVFSFIVALSWRIGLRFGLRSIGRESDMPKIEELNVPERLVWFLFVPLTLVLLKILLAGRGMDLNTGIVGFAVSNSLYIMVALYGLQGFGLLQYLMVKKKVNPGIRRMTSWSIPLALLIFPLNLVVLILLPGLGVSELWINYRQNDKELVQ